MSLARASAAITVLAKFDNNLISFECGVRSIRHVAAATALHCTLKHVLLYI